MKKLSFLLAFIFMMGSIALHAQTEKGKLFLQGSSNLGLDFGKNKTKSNGTTQDNYKYSDFWFKPMVGYTVIDNMPVGGFFDVDFWKYKWPDSDNKSNGISFLVGPFIRYYPFNLKGFKPMAELGAGLGVSNSTYTYGSSESKDKSFYFDFWAGAGGTYFVNDYLGIDALMGFERESFKYKATESPESRSSSEGYTDIYTCFFLRVGVVVMVGEGK